MPFMEVLSIKGAPSLHAIACANIAGFPFHLMARRAIRAICMNAVDYVPPQGPLVAFMFNAFDHIILVDVLKKILDAAMGSVDPSYLLYKNPRYRDTVVANSHFSRIDTYFGTRVNMRSCYPGTLRRGPIPFRALRTGFGLRTTRPRRESR
jgi:hypothetical protein